MADTAGLTRVRPYDIRELITKFGASADMEAAIVAIRAGSAYKCPKCPDDPVDVTSGKGQYQVNIGTEEEPENVWVHCEICDGIGKTVDEGAPVTEIVGYEFTVPEGP